MADFSGGIFRLNDNKAGLSQLEEGLSKEDISRILTEASEGSAFFENKKHRHKAIEERIATKRKQLEQASFEDLDEALRKSDLLLDVLEKSRDLTRTIVHVDMDMFFAAVEIRDDPSLKNKPVAVGGNSMLSTSNYLARKFGVRAAQPGFMAKKLCPHLIIVPPNFEKYRAVGKVVRGVFAEYDPNFSSFSLDEGFLDITDHLAKRSTMTEEERTLWSCDCEYYRSISVDLPVPEEGALQDADKCPLCGRPAEKLVANIEADGAVQELRLKIFQRTSLTCSAGISVNSMLAKICTDKNKPNGQFRLPADRDAILDFVKDLPVRKIPGIGATTEEQLQAFGIRTCSDLHEQRQILALLFSELSLEHFLRVSLGLGSTSLGSDEERKSISTERTFSEISAPDQLFGKLKELTEDLVESMEGENICGKNVSIKLKLVTFESMTRAQTVPFLIRKFDEIYPVAKRLLEHEIKLANGKLRLRLMGVRMSQLQPVSDMEPLQQKTLSQFFQRSPSKAESSSAPEIRLKRSHGESSFLRQSSTLSVGASVEAECPSCGVLIHTDSEYHELNRHIDDCLNKAVLNSVNSRADEISPISKRPKMSTSKSPRSKLNRPVNRKITDYLTRN